MLKPLTVALIFAVVAQLAFSQTRIVNPVLDEEVAIQNEEDFIKLLDSKGRVCTNTRAPESCILSAPDISVTLTPKLE